MLSIASQKQHHPPTAFQITQNLVPALNNNVVAAVKNDL
jgi:hypothetical protein